MNNSSTAESSNSDSRTLRTRRQLVDAATRLFAENAFPLVTASTIAKQAGCPLSAINYHFGSKEGLYKAMLEELISERMAQWPLPDVINAASVAEHPADERLRQMIHTLVHRMIAPGIPAPIARILVREFSHPTDALDLLFERVARPALTLLTALVMEITGINDPRHAQRLVFSLMGQCTFFLFARPLISRLEPSLYASDESVCAVADQIADFSLAALRHLPLPISPSGA